MTIGMMTDQSFPYLYPALLPLKGTITCGVPWEPKPRKVAADLETKLEAKAVIGVGTPHGALATFKGRMAGYRCWQV
jgi:hypothetical protein